jgi:thiol-disulfide isomerase/thioredoxin
MEGNMARYLLVMACAALLIGVVCPVEAQQPNQVRDLLEEASAALSSGKIDEAVTLLKQANKAAGGRCSPCWRKLAEAHLKQGNARDALKDGDKAAATAADNVERAEAQDIRGQALLRLAAEQPAKLKDAEAAFRAAADADPKEAMYHARLGLALLRQKRDEEGIAELKAYLASGPDPSTAAIAEQWIADPRRAREQFAPEFSLTTLQGESLSLKSLAGKVVVLDFWATWCTPCVASIPELRELQKRYSREEVVVISVSVDQEEAAWRDCVRKKNMDWPQYWDRDGAIRELFRVNVFPTYVVIDGEGIIRQRIQGLNPQQSLAARLRKQLEMLSGPGR